MKTPWEGGESRWRKFWEVRALCRWVVYNTAISSHDSSPAETTLQIKSLTTCKVSSIVLMHKAGFFRIFHCYISFRIHGDICQQCLCQQHLCQQYYEE